MLRFMIFVVNTYLIQYLINNLDKESKGIYLFK